MIDDRRATTLSIRVTPDDYTLITRAVEIHNSHGPAITIAAFVRWAALKAAREVIGTPAWNPETDPCPTCESRLYASDDKDKS